MKGTKVQTFFKIMMAMIFRIKTYKYWISNIIKMETNVILIPIVIVVIIGLLLFLAREDKNV